MRSCTRPLSCRSALSNVADEGLLTDGFFWIPSLAGPTTVNVRRAGGQAAPCSSCRVFFKPAAGGVHF